MSICHICMCKTLLLAFHLLILDQHGHIFDFFLVSGIKVQKIYECNSTKALKSSTVCWKKVDVIT